MISPFQNPFLLGFDGLEDLLFRVAKGADSFPPYNVEQISSELLRVTFAVAGYSEEELEQSAQLLYGMIHSRYLTTAAGLKQLRSAEQVAKMRGKTVEEILG